MNPENINALAQTVMVAASDHFNHINIVFGFRCLIYLMSTKAVVAETETDKA